MIPAIRTPNAQANTLVLKSKSRILAANVPVHAPVPGTGMTTNNNIAKNIPLPAFACSFTPAFSPFLKQKAKNLKPHSNF